MKEGVIGSSWLNKHKVLAVALAPAEPFWKWLGIHPLNAFQGLVAYCHTSKQADLSHAFMRPLRFHTGAQGILLVNTARSIQIKLVRLFGLSRRLCISMRLITAWRLISTAWPWLQVSRACPPEVRRRWPGPGLNDYMLLHDHSLHVITWSVVLHACNEF
jgi:hypothetical protein